MQNYITAQINHPIHGAITILLDHNTVDAIQPILSINGETYYGLSQNNQNTTDNANTQPTLLSTSVSAPNAQTEAPNTNPLPQSQTAQIEQPDATMDASDNQSTTAFIFDARPYLDIWDDDTTTPDQPTTTPSTPSTPSTPKSNVDEDPSWLEAVARSKSYDNNLLNPQPQSDTQPQSTIKPILTDAEMIQLQSKHNRKYKTAQRWTDPDGITNYNTAEGEAPIYPSEMVIPRDQIDPSYNINYYEGTVYSPVLDRECGSMTGLNDDPNYLICNDEFCSLVRARSRAQYDYDQALSGASYVFADYCEAKGEDIPKPAELCVKPWSNPSTINDGAAPKHVDVLSIINKVEAHNK